MGRREISGEDISEAIEDCIKELYTTLEAKGNRSFASVHEIGGTLKEEYDEFWSSVYENDQYQVIEKLKDIATDCMFGIACIKTGAVDW